jgi:hypothetical protein
MADKDANPEDYDVRIPKGFLTPLDDTTVGGGGNPYGGIGWSQLDETRRRIGESARHQLFPEN